MPTPKRRWGTTRFVIPPTCRTTCTQTSSHSSPRRFIPFEGRHTSWRHGLYGARGQKTFFVPHQSATGTTVEGLGDSMWLRAFCTPGLLRGPERFTLPALQGTVNRHPAKGCSAEPSMPPTTLRNQNPCRKQPSPLRQVIETGGRPSLKKTINAATASVYTICQGRDRRRPRPHADLAALHSRWIHLPLTFRRVERHPPRQQGFYPLSANPFLVVCRHPTQRRPGHALSLRHRPGQCVNLAINTLACVSTPIGPDADSVGRLVAATATNLEEILSRTLDGAGWKV